MYQKEIILSVILVVSVSCVSCKVFTRCTLAKELLRQGFPKEDLKKWVCLVEKESERNTRFEGGPSRQGMFNLGLFQIDETYFCGDSKPGGECKVKCDDLLSDNITKAAQCAKYIEKTYGFESWAKYQQWCTYYLPELSLCGIHY